MKKHMLFCVCFLAACASLFFSGCGPRLEVQGKVDFLKYPPLVDPNEIQFCTEQESYSDDTTVFHLTMETVTSYWWTNNFYEVFQKKGEDWYQVGRRVTVETSGYGILLMDNFYEQDVDITKLYKIEKLPPGEYCFAKIVLSYNLTKSWDPTFDSTAPSEKEYRLCLAEFTIEEKE